jgi:ZIP family zinc transporter
LAAINYWELLLLGSIAGFTIFLGLPLARLQNASPKRKGFLNAIAIGILVFLIIDVFGHAWNSAGDVANDTIAGKVPFVTGVTTVAALFGGLAIGLLGLVVYESRYMSGRKNTASLTRRKGLSFQNDPATRTEPIVRSRDGTETSRGSRVLAGLVGGGPTFLGTVLGSLWTSTITSIFFLSVAGGALIYVSMLMYNSGRRQTTNNILMLGIFVGLCAGFITDLIITLGGA